MKRRLLVYPLLSIAGLALAALSGVGYLLHSEQGSRWLLGRLSPMLPGKLELGRFEGSFTGPLQIDALSYRDGELRLEIGRIRFDWRPAELLEWRLHLTELALQDSSLTLPAAESEVAVEAEPATPFEGLSLPLKLRVDALSVDHFRYRQGQDTEPLVLERLNLQAAAEKDRVALTRLEASGFSAQVMLSGELQLTQGLPSALETRWSYRLPEGPELRGQGKISGNLQELRIEQLLAPPIGGELQAGLFELESSPRWEATLELEKTNIGAFAEGFPARVKGRLQGHGTFQDVALDAGLELVEETLGRLNAEIQARYADGQVLAERLLITTPEGSRLEGRGRYVANTGAGELRADLKWSELRWPLAGAWVQYFSRDGSLQLQGNPGDYRYHLDADLNLPEIPPAQGRIQASGSGSLHVLVLDESRLQLQQGQILGSGRASWEADPQWNFQLTGEGLNPGLFQREFPGNLALALTTQGRVHETEPHAEVILRKLEGELRGYPLQATGEARLDGQLVRIGHLALQSSENQLQLQGEAGEKLEMSWVLDAPRLESLWPELKGALYSKGALSGSMQTPRIETTIQASQVAYAEQRVGELQAEGEFELAADQRGRLEVRAGQLALGDQSWDELHLTVGGLRSSHQIEMQLKSQRSPEASLQIDAGLANDNTWSGELQSLTLGLREFGNWQLRSPAAFTVGEKAQAVSRACLQSAEASVCGGFTAKAESGWQGNLQASDIPLAMLRHWLPEETRVQGRVNLHGEVQQRPEQGLLGSAKLDIPEANLLFELGGEPRNIDLSGGMVSASIDAQAGRGDLSLPLAGLGGIKGNLLMPGLNVLQLEPEKQTVAGRFEARIEDLSQVSAVLPSLQNLKGAVAANFALGGTLGEPNLQGEARLQEGAVDVPEIGLKLRELNLLIAAKDLNRLDLSGSVRSGDGVLEMSGLTRLDPAAGFPSEWRVKGENWVAVDVPEAEVRVSPELDIRISRTRSELNGEVVIPYARIRPREVPESAVAGSPDLEVIDSEAPPQQKQELKFYSKLRISFGKRVSFDGMGLRGNLTGSLLVTDEPGRPVTGSGRLGIEDGTYKAYGQDLKIERGYALFADSPVDNPGLDVRAVREVDDVTAGLRVTGTLKNPKLTLFSEPAMSESHVLSYILTGRAPGESSGEGAGLMAALQAAGAGDLASEIGRQFGLEELRVETGSTLDEASVVAGTYLSPRLYVQYVNELATGETKLRLRYDLTKKLQLQTESGTSQGADLFYTIER